MKEQKNLDFYTQTSVKVFVVAGSYIAFGTVIYHFLERFSWLDSIYFVVVTLGTIGYGDIAPRTNAGKIFTIFFVIFGLAIFSTLITNIISRGRERRERKLKETKK